MILNSNWILNLLRHGIILRGTSCAEMNEEDEQESKNDVVSSELLMLLPCTSAVWIGHVLWEF